MDHKQPDGLESALVDRAAVRKNATQSWHARVGSGLWQRSVQPGGQMGITAPGFLRELNGRLPEHFLPFWAQECWT